MRRLFISCLVAGSMLAVLWIAPVSAASRQDVTMTVTTTFDDDPDAFTATGLPDCSSGLVYDGGAHVQFTRGHGIFAGYKVFDCGSDNGFVVRLNARFGSSGSSGTWAVVDAWGSLAGMWGAGKLMGEPIDENSILDNYWGTVTL
jgi:hypothetical protein